MRLARVRSGGGGGLRGGSPTIVLPLRPRPATVADPRLRKPRRTCSDTRDLLTFSLLSHERYRIGATRSSPARRASRLTSPRSRTQISGATGATGATCPRRSSLSWRREHESGRWIMRRAICWRAVVIGPAALDRFTSIYALSLMFSPTIYRNDLIIYLNYLSSISPVSYETTAVKSYINVIASWLTT